MNRAAPIALVLVAVGGCGNTPYMPVGDGAATTFDLARPRSDGSSPQNDGATSLADLAMAAGYPAGPYGATVGDVLPPLSWIGYFDPHSDAVATTEPYAAYSMDQLRTSGAPYALLHISEFI